MIVEGKFVIIVLLTILSMHVASATTVELINPEKLPTQLKEGEQVDYTIKIDDYDDSKDITIETSLISSNNKPIYDFGELNPTISENRYNSTMTIGTHNIPKTLQITVSGKVPGGEITNNYGDIIVTKFRDPKLKYYDIHVDKKMVVIESFELIILKKKTFDDTMEQVTRAELSGIKRYANKLFDKGLISDAQDIVSEMISIKWPNSLSLFGIIKIDSNFWLDIIVLIILAIGLLIGFLVGANIDNNRDDD